MLPITVLRRLDGVLAQTRAKVVAAHEKRKGGKLSGGALDTTLIKAAGQRFHDHSSLDFAKLERDPRGGKKQPASYDEGFSTGVQCILEHFEFEAKIEQMHEANIDKALGREPRLNSPATWDEIEALLKKRSSRWKATEQKLFRSVFTQRDAKAGSAKLGAARTATELTIALLKHRRSAPIAAVVTGWLDVRAAA